MSNYPLYKIYPCGDHAFTLDFGQHINTIINDRVIDLFHQLNLPKHAFIRDLIPAYSSITVVYDPIMLLQQHLSPEKIIHDLFQQAIHSSENISTEISTSITRIPVCYHTSLAPDLQALAEAHKLSREVVIELHCNTVYRVYMNGFLPGFAYMGTVDDRIATPRLETPRKIVPAGSVGIAGNQTGIYPLESPGGWQLIGRTPVRIFKPAEKEPCLLRPGQQIQFYPISLEQFQNQWEL